MEKKLLELLICMLHFSSIVLSFDFNPVDNYLVDCGGNGTTTVDNRHFIGDDELNSFFLSATPRIILRDQNPSMGSSPLYHTARVFTAVSSYEFKIKETGIHLVRLHFVPFHSKNYNLNDAQFNVLVDGFLVLKRFQVQSENSIELKEFIVKLNDEKFEIIFQPLSRSSFGFVTAIEVFSAPKDLIYDDGAKHVTSSITEKFKGLSSYILETVYRINVGGPKITPSNDTLWRTWIPDEEFLTLERAAKRVARASTPSYQEGGATRMIAPDDVYSTAREMNTDDSIAEVNFNLTWKLPLNNSGVLKYFIRMHFCNIVSNLRTFNIYLNDYLAYEDLKLSSLFHTLVVPYYIDFVTDSDDSDAIRVSLGSSPPRPNAILNGIEVMKMMNMGLDSNSRRRPTKKNIRVLVGSIVGGFTILCLFILVLLQFRKKKANLQSKSAENMTCSPSPLYRRSSRSKVTEGSPAASIHENRRLKISLVEVQLATDNFNKSLIIGSGGFGTVYKGVLRDNTKVAVKRGGVQGTNQGLPEFHTEIMVLSKIRHRHLVSLMGFCDEQSEMILVYEFMEKGPLKNHLYGSGLPTLSWKQRLQICIGSARGLHYLHTGSAEGIIHRDVKSANILLDENYVAKVADFGISRSGPRLEKRETHVSTAVKGSFGYFDPEYFRTQKLTDKSDVYSFGVVLLEVLCARSALDRELFMEQMNIAEWAMQWQKKGMLEQIIDPKLVGKINKDSLKKYGETVEKCLADHGVDRPSMGDVLWNLEYALRLQEKGDARELHEDSSTADVSTLPLPNVIPRVPSSSMNTESTDDESSDLTLQVFSQLITNDGR